MYRKENYMTTSNLAVMIMVAATTTTTIQIANQQKKKKDRERGTELQLTGNRQQATGNKPLQLAGHGVGYICVFVMINSCGGGEGRGRTDTLVAS